MKSFFLLLFFFIFTGASSAAEPQTWDPALKKSQGMAQSVRVGSHDVPIPADLPPDLVALAKQAMPQIPRLCPGWAKYEGAYTKVALENNIVRGAGGYLNLVVVVTGETPDAYRAQGHKCYYSVSPDGAALSVSKRSCQSLCLDVDMFAGPSRELILPIE